MVEIIHAKRARLVQLADDLLDLSRACEGTLRVRRELNLASLLSCVRDICTPILQAQGQVPSVELPPDRSGVASEATRGGSCRFFGRCWWARLAGRSPDT